MRWRAVLMALLTVVLTTAGLAAPASAAPVYEITGTWIDVATPPEAVASGTPVVADWRVNVNDDAQPPGNEPVQNMVVEFVVANAAFVELPDLCRTAGVEPTSSISEDGTLLVCNLGTVAQGTAVALQAPLMADGPTGSQITMSGAIDGQVVDLPPIPIVNPFGMDIRFQTASSLQSWNENTNRVELDFAWTIFHTTNSDPGPDTVTYRITTSATTAGTGVAQPVSIGTSVDTGQVGCAENRRQAVGHPRSGTPGQPAQNAAFPTCTLTAVGPNQYDLTISGLDYAQDAYPTQDSQGAPMPTDRVAIAAGTIWFRVATEVAGQLMIRANAPTYTAPTGQTAVDNAANNSTTKTYTLPGGWSSAWNRQYTNFPGSPWDDNYRVAAGTEVQQAVLNNFWSDDSAPGALYGNCLALDTRYVTFTEASVTGFAEPLAYQYQYYTGPGGGGGVLNPASPNYNPNVFDCGIADGNWSTQLPADLQDVRAVRLVYPFSAFAAAGGGAPLRLLVRTQIHDDVAAGQDIWEFGSVLRNGVWVGPNSDTARTPTPGARYPHTNGRRDILRVITATPAIEKTAERLTVVPGAPLTYTLTYSANGSGAIPETVDDYAIVDTLPVGMTYVPGSAAPEPSVSMDAGRQVLTWTLDGVATNEEHTLTYDAVADTSIEPGVGLTNTVTSSLAGTSSEPAQATVTSTTNGYTTILKTPDVEFIPNQNGDGVGEGSWTVSIESSDPYPQAFTDTIDILPYNGDQRGTEFSGSYELGEIGLPDGGTVYYTDADPASLTYDPADPSNGAAGDPTGNTVGWTVERPENPTAIRVIGGELAPGGTFSFVVPIITDGAQPQDVYVNSAQARAEHTTLVMRTSAALVVTDYVVAKVSDPASGTTVSPGETITYTVTVTQQGPVPAGAWFRDSFAEVLDDAVYNEDVQADIGTASYADGVLSWEGTLPVGEVATITYSVTVKDIAGLRADGDTLVRNQVESPGCVQAGSCTTEHPVGYWTVSKTSDPAPGETVSIGDVITYTVQMTQHGEGAVEGAVIHDDLTGVLDDATWNDDAAAGSGAVAYSEPTLSWVGDLAVGAVVDLTYSVTVTGGGDWILANVVTPECAEGATGCTPPPPGECVPAPDQNPECQTWHEIGDYLVWKDSDPDSGSAVEVGQVITYTVTVEHIGVADVDAELTDDLSDVLDDATWNDDAAASAGELAYGEQTLSWTGSLSQGDVVTLTYSVTVIPDGNLELVNDVDVPNKDVRCVPAEGQGEACTTTHEKGSFTYSKTSDPEPGTVVGEGDVVTYTVTVTQHGPAAVGGASLVDDISEVLPVASWNDDATASTGEVTRVGDEVRWNGDLAIGQVVTITYSVTVGDRENAELRNVVTSDDPRGSCVEAADGNPGCQTEHRTPGGLPATGVSLALGGAGLLLTLAGGLLVAAVRDRRSKGEAPVA